MQVSKWGNSLAVRLPKKLVDEMALRPGDELTIVHASKLALTVEKSDQRQRALDDIAMLRWKLPEGYKFDRDEANKR
jgi:antitoxin MazE